MLALPQTAQQVAQQATSPIIQQTIQASMEAFQSLLQKLFRDLIFSGIIGMILVGSFNWLVTKAAVRSILLGILKGYVTERECDRRHKPIDKALNKLETQEND